MSAEVAGWMAAAEAAVAAGPATLTPYLLVESGDDRVVDRRLNRFLPLEPFSPYAPLFFDGSLARDFLTDTFEPLALTAFGVVAPGLRLELPLGGAGLEVAATALRTQRAAPGGHELGWDWDAGLAGELGRRWGWALDLQLLRPGAVVAELAGATPTVALAGLTVRYRF